MSASCPRSSWTVGSTCATASGGSWCLRWCSPAPRTRSSLRITSGSWPGAISDARYLEVPGGHGLPFEDPARFFSIITKFVDAQQTALQAGASA